MPIAGMPEWSLRLERAESSRLAWAFAISLVLHLLVFGTYQTGKKFNLWQQVHWPAWMQSHRMLTEILKKQELAQLKPQQPQVPLMFVDVSPAQTVAEPPKNPKGYSDRNSLAANPEATKQTDIPKINGKQTQVVRTEDAPREQFVPLQPSPPVQPPQKEQPEVKPKAAQTPRELAMAKPTPAPRQDQDTANKPKPAYTPGDLVMAKPAPVPRKDEGEAIEAKPTPAPRQDEGEAIEAKPPHFRTVAEARASRPNTRLPGEKMQQDGGVARHALDPGFDVAASPFGAYDRALIEAVSHRWYSLLDQHAYVSDSRGKVVLQFHLHPDGSITEMNVAETTVGEMLSLLCQRAVLDTQPFAAWPADMRRLLGSMLSITFTFYYN